MARLSASTIYGKLKATGEAIVNGVLRVKNGITVEGSEDHEYAGIKAGDNANDGHLMLDSNGGNLYLNWDTNDNINLDNNNVVASRDFYSATDGRILLRAEGSNGELGFYDGPNSKWTIRQYNGGDLNLDAVGNIDLKTSTYENGNRIATRNWVGDNYDNYGSFTFEEGDGESTTVSSGERAIIDGGGGLNTELIDTSPAEIQVRHNDTSAQGNVSTGGATVIDDIGLDGYGHVDNINTENRSLDDWANANSAINLGGNDIHNVRQIDGSSGNLRIRFDDNNYFVEIADQNNNREELVTEDTYIDVAGTWIGEDHLGVSDAHHSRYTDSEAVSAVEGSTLSTVEFSSTTAIEFADPGMDLNQTAPFNSLPGSVALLSDTDTTLFQVFESGNVEVPNGQLSEQGNRVATRSWSTSNNINHADLGTTASDDHHSRYADSEAIEAVEYSTIAQLNFNGTNAINYENTNIRVQQLNGYVEYYDKNLGSDNGGGSVLQINEGGNIDIENGNLNIKSGQLDTQGAVIARANTAGNVRLDGNSIEVTYSGNNRYGFSAFHRLDGTRGGYIGYGNGADTMDLQLDNASKLELAGGDLMFGDTTQQNIVDNNDNQRISFKSDNTVIRPSDQHNGVVVTSDVIQMTTNSAHDFRIFDGQNKFSALKYTTSNQLLQVPASNVSMHGETTIEAELSSLQSLSYDTYETVTFDTTTGDPKGEFDETNHQFSPDNSGWYDISISLYLTGGSAGEIVSVRLYDKSVGTAVLFKQKERGGGFVHITANKTIKLNSSDNYEVQVINRNSSNEEITAQSSSTYWTIRSAFDKVN